MSNNFHRQNPCGETFSECDAWYEAECVESCNTCTYISWFPNGNDQHAICCAYDPTEIDVPQGSTCDEYSPQ